MLVQPITRSWRLTQRRLLNLPAGMARRQLKSVRRKFYSDLWTTAAACIGAQLIHRPNDLIQINRNGLATFVRHSDLMLDSGLTVRVMADKTLNYELMASHSVRMPAFVSFTLDTLEEAARFLADLDGGPIVVKPAAGTGGGRGVITGIRSLEALKAAARHSAGFNRSLLAEEQLTGASHRLLYFDASFIDAIRRDSPTVTGNGRANMAKLIKAENAKRFDPRNIVALNPLILDDECRNTLRADGRSPSFVPADGEIVRVKLAVNENAAAQNHVVRDQVHQEVIDTGARLVRALGIKFAGLDVTSDDISLPLEAGNTVFNEVNVNPGIHHHYLVANQDARIDVAVELLKRMFDERLGIVKL